MDITLRITLPLVNDLDGAVESVPDADLVIEADNRSGEIYLVRGAVKEAVGTVLSDDLWEAAHNLWIFLKRDRRADA